MSARTLWTRDIMELARYGVPYSEVMRDPRPSRLADLLSAGRVIDARFRLEDTEDTVNTGGVQGEIKETGGPPPARSKYPPMKTDLVGFKRRQEELTRRAYPEEFTANTVLERRRAEQKAKLDAFWGSERITQATPLKFRVVREGGEVHVLAVQGRSEGAGSGDDAGDSSD